MEKVIAYKATDGKLFYSDKEATEYSEKLWEERLARFMKSLKLDETFNPVKNHVKIMEFLILNKHALKDIFNCGDFDEYEEED